MGCGGKALALYPKSVPDLVSTIELLEGLSVCYRVLGNTTNVLPPSEDSDTVFVFTKRVREIGFDKCLFAATGVSSTALLKECETRSLTGAEFLTGIPCTVGGAAYMNAGVAGAYMDSIVKSVLVYKDGGIVTLDKKECGYSYKKSVFMQDKSIILGVFFDLKRAKNGEIQERLREYSSRRKDLPTGKSLGCIFKNPDGFTAGKLIEGAGLKGLRVGGAVVSTKHANFIINDNRASVKDVKSLILIIKNAVFAQYGIRLEEEIEYLT